MHMINARKITPRLPHTTKTPRDSLKRDRRCRFEKIADKLIYYDSRMSHQKDCYRLGVLSSSRDPSGARVGLLVGVPEEILRL